ncbi:MAG: YaiI/YqxD family protein [Zetaproteobacteria bacterium]|nr:YaiI/YqxD family protein [Zetaproteobacteria bacterium]
MHEGQDHSVLPGPCIWIDGDACPRPVKEVIFNCSRGRKVKVTLVSNNYQRILKSPLVQQVVVGAGHDEADDYIVDHIGSHDIAVTADIPLADRLVKLGVIAINPSGEVYTAANMSDRLATRNLLTELRSAGLPSTTAPGYSNRDKHRFASALDKHVTRMLSLSRG